MLCREKRFISWMLVVGLVLLIFSPLPKARADGNPDEGWSSFEEDIPVHRGEFNSCNGDQVTIDGQLTLITRVKVQPDGTTSVKISQSLSATGSGTPSGAAYTLTDSSNTSIDGVTTLPFSFFVNRTEKLVGDGVQDMFVHSVVHVTINAEGTVTQELQNLNVNCNP
jgi:hypothetical protein